MWKLVLFFIIVPIFGYCVYRFNKSYTKSLEGHKDVLEEVKTETLILDAVEEIQTVRAANAERAQQLNVNK